MTEAEPVVTRGRKFSAVWIIPLVAVVAGAWMVIHTKLTEGPTITIDFATAEDLEEGKTKVRLLNVVVGQVEEVRLREDLSGITATVKLDRDTLPLLHEDTRFWVVRAQVGVGNVSGLGTLLSGAYIEMSPGTGSTPTHHFVALEQPPQTPQGAPGRRLTLFSDHASSVTTGDAVLYRGYKVGRVDATAFDHESSRVRYDVFIDAPFHELVHGNTRFWNVSGISLNASAEGVEVRMGSMDTLLLGGIAFDTPPGLAAGAAVDDGVSFRLYGSYGAILENPFRERVYYVVSFAQSLRGLNPGAPVEFRGLEIGRVERLLLKELVDESFGEGKGRAIPVLIYIEPGRMEAPDTPASIAAVERNIEKGVGNGLRATLTTGNLLTGKKLINFDYFADAEPAALGQFLDYPVIPSIETGVDRLEQQVNSFLEKLNALPLDTTVGRANDAIAGLEETLAAINDLVASEEVKALPAELVTTVEELRGILRGFSQDSAIYRDLRSSITSLNATLENLDSLTRQLSDKPNAVLFPAKPEADPLPEARR